MKYKSVFFFRFYLACLGVEVLLLTPAGTTETWTSPQALRRQSSHPVPQSEQDPGARWPLNPSSTTAATRSPSLRETSQSPPVAATTTPVRQQERATALVTKGVTAVWAGETRIVTRTKGEVVHAGLLAGPARGTEAKGKRLVNNSSNNSSSSFQVR